MKFILFLFCTFLATAPAAAQIELVSDDYFPAEFEFQEIREVTLDEALEDSAGLSRIDGGALFSDVGFQKYARRVYSVGEAGAISVEIVTLLDSRAAYSVLTLLRTGGIQDGPPGDAFTTAGGEIRFSQGKRWVRIHGRGAPDDLPKRVAISVSNRIGGRRLKPPSLVSHMPVTGYDASSLRYYPSKTAFESHSGSTAVYLRTDADFEIAQSRYSVDGRSGILSLLSFPTAEVAEEYYSGLTGGETGGKTYAKMAGPIVGVLEGSFDPAVADRILSDIRFSYSVRWIEDKPKTIWGVPAGILTTVVKSLFFVAILCGVSIVAGIGFAAFRVMLREHFPKHSPDSPERTELTRLRMR